MPPGVVRLVALAATALMLAGCATSESAHGAASPTASATPTCAVPAQPGVDPPPECVVYDPERNMAANEGYRERMPQSEAGRRAGEDIVPAITEALTALRESGATLTGDAVRSAIAGAGVVPEGIQVDERGGRVLFGFPVPEGGCVAGSVTPDAVTAEPGGFIMDGGCLAMVGH